MKNNELQTSLKNIECLLSVLIKKLTLILSSNGKKTAWLDPADADEAMRLRDENPELYDYVLKIIQLFLS